jgi:hypothetical protein
MKIKTNLRAGKGGASGTGQNSKGGGTDNPVGSEDPVVIPVSRCPGY